MTEPVSVGDIIREEMEARGWGRADVLARMDNAGAAEALALDIVLEDPPRGVLLGDDMAGRLALAFGVSARFLLNLDAAYQAAREVAP